MKRFKKGFLISEILCYLTIILMVGMFVLYTCRFLSKKYNNYNSLYEQEEEIYKVIDEIHDKSRKTSLEEKYYYRINDLYWEIYSGSGKSMVKYYFNSDSIWCVRKINLKYIKNILIEIDEFITITIISDDYEISTIIGGLDEYQEEDEY